MFFRGAEKKLKAAKALKEKGDTPEELLQSIKENEKAVAEAEKEVAAWKAIVGEKAEPDIKPRRNVRGARSGTAGNRMITDILSLFPQMGQQRKEKSRRTLVLPPLR